MWRILVGLSLIPAFGTLYQRLTLPESKRFEAASKNQDPAALEKGSIDDLKKSTANVSEASEDNGADQEGAKNAAEYKAEKSQRFHEFLVYFSEWRHFKVLLGTSVCWFLLDIAYVRISHNLLTTVALCTDFVIVTASTVST